MADVVGKMKEKQEQANSALMWFLAARKSGSVDRMHTFYTLRSQSVAEHTWHCVTMAATLHDRERVDQRRVMLALLTHDMAETYTGDVPANVKVDNPKLHEALHEIERKWEQNNLPDEVKATGLTQREAAFCSIIDTLEFMLYCCEERALGNTAITVLYYRAAEYISGRMAGHKWNVLPRLVDEVHDHFSKHKGNFLRHETL